MYGSHLSAMTQATVPPVQRLWAEVEGAAVGPAWPGGARRGVGLQLWYWVWSSAGGRGTLSTLDSCWVKLPGAPAGRPHGLRAALLYV